MSRHDRFIQRTAQLAALSDCAFMHGAIVVRNGNILSMAVNRWRNKQVTAPIEHATVHAEAAALSQVTNPKGATIYVARFGRDGKATMSRPCDTCYPLISKSGIKEVVFTCWDGSYLVERIPSLM